MTAPKENYYDFPTKGKTTVSAWMVSHWAGHDSMVGAAFAYLWRCGRKAGEALIKDLAKAIVALSTRILLAVEDGDHVSEDTEAELARAVRALSLAYERAHGRRKVDEAGKTFRDAIDDHLAARVAKVLKPKPKKGKP
jgi:hypothetical protein